MEKAQINAQQITGNSQTIMKTSNGQRKKTKNLTVSKEIKTVLAPNAPWPDTTVPIKRPQGRPYGWRKIRIDFEGKDLDFFASLYEETRPNDRENLLGLSKN